MKKLLKMLVLVGLVSTFAQGALATNLTGAGSTFVYPILAQWAGAYQKQTGNQINYQAIGSGGGISQIKAGTVDFAATDKPLSGAELKADKLHQFPLVVGGIVVSVNIKGLSAPLILDGATVAAIYSGNITYWDDAAIKALNSGVALPHQMITVVFRADGSGTTYNFTHYLASVSPNFTKQVGVNTLVSWTAQNKIGAKGNAGVANYVKTVDGSIGYIEYAYAKQTQLPIANLKNTAGVVVNPTLNSFIAGLANPNAKNSWPIIATTYILLPARTAANAKNLDTSFAFFTFCFEQGQAMATALDYVPLPKSIYEKIISKFEKAAK